MTTTTTGTNCYCHCYYYCYYYCDCDSSSPTTSYHFVHGCRKRRGQLALLRPRLQR